MCHIAWRIAGLLFGLCAITTTASAAHYCQDALKQPREAQFYVSPTPCVSRVGVREFPNEAAWKEARGLWDHRPTGRACCQRIDGTRFISPSGCDDALLFLLPIDQCKAAEQRPTAVPQHIPRTCEIIFGSVAVAVGGFNYPAIYFTARENGALNGRDCATSSDYDWPTDADSAGIRETPQRRRAVEALKATLLASGYEVTGRGQAWYGYRFRQRR
jgi:hypothetical protein